MIFACISPWVYPAWDSLIFLVLSECFLSHVREVFRYNLFRYFLGPFLSLLLWDPIMWMKVAQSCPSLCDPMDSTVYGILQARILLWVAFPFSRGSSQPRNWTGVSFIAGRFFTNWATREKNVNIAFNVPWVSLTVLVRFPFFPFILLCSSISTRCLPARLSVLPHLTCHWFL